MLKSALLAKYGKESTPTKKPSIKTKPNKPRGATPKTLKTKPKPTPKNKTQHVKSVPPKSSPKVEDIKFDEETLEVGEEFRVNPLTVSKAISGLIKFTSENPKLKSKLFDTEKFSIFMQVNSIKVPKTHSRIVRIPLKHPYLTPDSEVCFIAADVKGIPNKEHEKHVEHYEKIFKLKGVESIKKIMTFHEFRTDYETFEAKQRLVELYDAFLVDGKISGKAVKKCGKIFYKKRKVPSPVKMQASKLKEHIEQVLRKSALYLHPNGDSFMVRIGHSEMGLNEVVENALYVVKGLEKEFPGGFGNIRSLNVQSYRGISIPIYTTLKNQNQVDLSKNVKETKPEEPVFGELTTRLNAGVEVTPTGTVTVHKLKVKRKMQKKVGGDDRSRDSPNKKRKVTRNIVKRKVVRKNK